MTSKKDILKNFRRAQDLLKTARNQIESAAHDSDPEQNAELLHSLRQAQGSLRKASSNIREAEGNIGEVMMTVLSRIPDDEAEEKHGTTVEPARGSH